MVSRFEFPAVKVVQHCARVGMVVMVEQVAAMADKVRSFCGTIEAPCQWVYFMRGCNQLVKCMYA